MGQISREKGFTLIELMAVVAIVSILAAIGYPLYTRHVTDAKRAEGKAALLANASALERFYTMNNTYTTNLGDAGGKAFSGESAGTSAYAITVVAAGGGINQGFAMTATPNVADPVCGNLSINHTGAKSFSSSSGTVAKCW